MILDNVSLDTSVLKGGKKWLDSEFYVIYGVIGVFHKIQIWGIKQT